MIPLEKDDDEQGNTSSLVLRMFLNELEDSIIPADVRGREQRWLRN